MGDDKEHQRGKRQDKFCAVPSIPPCKGNRPCDGECAHYQEVCEPETAKWTDHAFARKIKSLEKAFPKKYEAHHILCVSPVSEQLLGQKETSKIYGAVAQTSWCINNQKNMMAMPLWGHTVKYYCAVTKAGGSLAAGGGLPPPGWANLPQHDIDHNSKQGYTWEVEQKMASISAKVEKASHTLSGDSLKAALNSWSGKFRAELKRRGGRKGGTDNAWKLAQAPTFDKDWSHPFSMASDGKVSGQAFPVRNFNEKVQRWIQRIASAMGA